MGCSNSTLHGNSVLPLSRSNSGIMPRSHCVEANLVPPFHQEDFRENWRLVQKLGEGSFAQVIAVTCKRSNRCAALKIQKIASDSHEAVREARVWEKIGRHENIVRLFGDVIIDGRIGLLMEKCEKSLSEHLIDMTTVSDQTMTHMFHEMTLAIAHLESVQIVHRDVKPDNFLCQGDDHILKLCDFGCSELMPQSGHLFGTLGTPLFMSPEMVADGPHNLKTDVWSLGATFYLMLYGECPYTSYPLTKKRVMQTIVAGYPVPRYHGREDIRCETKEAIVAMLRRSTTARISASEALQWPFLNFALVGASEQISVYASKEKLYEFMSVSTVDLGSNGGVSPSSASGLATPCFSLRLSL